MCKRYMQYMIYYVFVFVTTMASYITLGKVCGHTTCMQYTCLTPDRRVYTVYTWQVSKVYQLMEYITYIVQYVSCTVHTPFQYKPV